MRRIVGSDGVEEEMEREAERVRPGWSRKWKCKRGRMKEGMEESRRARRQVGREQRLKGRRVRRRRTTTRMRRRTT